MDSSTCCVHFILDILSIVGYTIYTTAEGLSWLAVSLTTLTRRTECSYSKSPVPSVLSTTPVPRRPGCLSTIAVRDSQLLRKRSRRPFPNAVQNAATCFRASCSLPFLKQPVKKPLRPRRQLPKTSLDDQSQSSAISWKNRTSACFPMKR
jgi:hypothetical protein